MSKEKEKFISIRIDKETGFEEIEILDNLKTSHKILVEDELKSKGFYFETWHNGPTFQIGGGLGLIKVDCQSYSTQIMRFVDKISVIGITRHDSENRNRLTNIILSKYLNYKRNETIEYLID